MHKVLVERPRRGGGHEPGERRLPFEDQPVRGPMRERQRRTKWLSENLSPLERYLQSQVGRPWRLVYSEIRRNLAPRNAVQMHILQHLFQFIATDVWLVDGVPWTCASGRERPVGTGWGRLDFYVCPKSGLLKVPKPRRK